MRSILPLTIAGALFATPLQAEPRSAVVTVSSAELSTPAGTARFNKRVAAAIEQVCGSYATIEAYQVPQLDECRRSAWRGVETRIAALKASGEIQLSSR